MARVASLHGRKGITDLNPIDVKVRIEGDGDGDKVHVELLTPENTKLYKEFMKNKKPSELNLENFVKKTTASIFSTAGKIKLIAQLTFGSNSIAEIANVQSAYGAMVNIYKSFTTQGSPDGIQPGRKIEIRNPEEIMNTDLYYKLTDNKKWSGSVEEFLRIYLQAAVDNGKYNLLSDWNYNQDELARQLFKYTDGKTINVQDYKVYIKPIFNLHKEAARIRKGIFQQGGKMSTQQLISRSQEYLEFVEKRIWYIQPKLEKSYRYNIWRISKFRKEEKT